MKADATAWIEDIIKDFIDRSPENTLQSPFREKAFENPLVGFSRGDDPLYDSYKEVVGPYHWTPLEIFTQTFPGINVEAAELAVISWILPQTQATRADNRQQSTYPAERWARARIFGEEVNVKLRKRVVDILQKAGSEAVACCHLGEEKIRSICICIHLVGAACCLCCRSGDLWIM